jgi:hypothetical protein
MFPKLSPCVFVRFDVAIFDRQWEDVDHDLDGSVPGALLSPTGSGEGDGDCLGLETDVR